MVIGVSSSFFRCWWARQQQCLPAGPSGRWLSACCSATRRQISLERLVQCSRAHSPAGVFGLTESDRVRVRRAAVL